MEALQKSCAVSVKLTNIAYNENAVRLMLLLYKCVERMCGEIYVQIFLSKLDAEGLCLVIRVAADDNALAVRTLEDDGLQTVFYRIKGQKGAARLHEMREVLVGVVLRSIAISAIRRAHLHEGILFPAPSAAALIAKYEIPVIILVAATTDVLV